MGRNENYLPQVRKALEDIGGVCQRCILRFGGCKSAHKLRDIVKPKEEDCSPPAKRAKGEGSGALCRACHGILQDDCMDGVLSRVCDEIKAAAYGSDHYAISISLPVSFALRHHALTIYLAEQMPDFDENQVPPIKQVWKWLFPRSIENKLGKKFVKGEDCDFSLVLQLESSTDDEELNCLSVMCKSEYAERMKNRKKYNMGVITRQSVEESLDCVTHELFKQHYPVPPSVPSLELTHLVKMSHTSVYVAGRYNKFSRHLSQTSWIANGQRVMETSIEELILLPLKAAFKFDSAKFRSSGREDVDVRMLGTGRPFVFELVNPRAVNWEKELPVVEREINRESSEKCVFVRDLKIVPKESLKLLKEGEDKKRKTYEALCVLPLDDSSSVEEFHRKLDTLQYYPATVLHQRTPLRTLHRRSNLTREREVYSMEATPLRQEETIVPKQKRVLFKLEICTQAGTYVKEFVHGDFGRTTPNLRTILGYDNIDIIALDVKAVHLQWPPLLDDAIAVSDVDSDLALPSP